MMMRLRRSKGTPPTPPPRRAHVSTYSFFLICFQVIFLFPLALKCSFLLVTACVLFFLQTLRERRKAGEQTEGQTAEKTTQKKVEEEDENSPFNGCSSVDLDKVCVCV